ncbi:MAG: GNAT family N-acetyltransferase, partial [Clostridia bacterium]|nr:GNAT family N-acetyltransferase [Clostridia bacterium]
MNININDYSIDQCKAWVNKSDSLRLHKARLLEQNTIVVEINSKIVGFASLDNDNCLDLLYVHKDYQ